MSDACPGWSFASNHSEDEDGRIIVMWRNPVTASVMHKSKQSLTCQVNIPGTPPYYYTAIYAANTNEEINDLWIELLNLQLTLQTDNTPWIIAGDFNEILHPSEHSSPDVNQFTSPMVDFKSCIDQLEVRDLRFHGTRFSWSNKSPSNPIAKKLDRALINESWLNTYPSSLANFLAPEISDHTPCCIHLDCHIPQAGTKPFKFYNYLSYHPDFLAVVANAWIDTENEEHSLHNLNVKQKMIKRELKALNKNNFSDIQKRVCEANSLFSFFKKEC
ncbi:hypothetical protein V5N11_030477 [Cardamine amara subsp. amara]|uniref:Endonuclease/exonuclease/phosphatase domain-containing protein n=1 Tax=Cardamine amara subsp. amara TaxID=228776 RepID=A0ABD0Z6N8_CARAN